jgi:hypothetical protein
MAKTGTEGIIVLLIAEDLGRGWGWGEPFFFSSILLFLLSS